MDEIEGWYVVFVDGMGNNFWDVVTCKKFRHCYAFRWDGYNWIVVDALSQSLEVHILPFGQEVDLPKETLALGHQLVYFTKLRRGSFIFRGLMTCVSTVKHLLGIRAWWIVTPKQLYNYLTKE